MWLWSVCWRRSLTLPNTSLQKRHLVEELLLQQKKIHLSSLHCIISLSFCSFSYNGVCYDKLKLSVDDIIVSQKGSNGDRKLHGTLNEPREIHSILQKEYRIKTKIVQWRLLFVKAFVTRTILEGFHSLRIKHNTVGIWITYHCWFWMFQTRSVVEWSGFWMVGSHLVFAVCNPD